MLRLMTRESAQTKENDMTVYVYSLTSSLNNGQSVETEVFATRAEAEAEAETKVWSLFEAMFGLPPEDDEMEVPSDWKRAHEMVREIEDVLSFVVIKEHTMPLPLPLPISAAA